MLDLVSKALLLRVAKKVHLPVPRDLVHQGRVHQRLLSVVTYMTEQQHSFFPPFVYARGSASIRWIQASRRG